ncbi:hypothetical protein CCHR01_19161, partial [Colletotrichum chrysophilum]
MEPVGLAVGIAGLAGLFSTCLEVVEKVDSYKNFKHDSHSLNVQFQAEKRRFEQWGSAVGINKCALSGAHHPALDDPQTLSTAKELLSLIQRVCADADDTASETFILGDIGPAKRELSVPKHVQPRGGAPSKSVRRKIAWSFGGKARRTAQVVQFGVLVQLLHNIVPPRQREKYLRRTWRIGKGPRPWTSARFARERLPGNYLHQVMTRDDVAFSLVRKTWLAQNESVATRATIVRLFQDIVQAVPSCTFVLDGQDECAWMGDGRNGSDSVPGFLETLTRVVTGCTARILVVSRNEPDIRDVIGDASTYLQLEMSTEDVRSDTLQYSRSIVDRKLQKKDDTTKTDIAQRMADRSNGQFLWLKLHEDSLRSWKNKTQLEDAIDKTPPGLEHAYERNWSRISRLPELEKHRAYSLLRWAAFALRPLTASEITEAVLVNGEDDEFPIDELPNYVDDDYIDNEILRPCGSLLETRDTSTEAFPGPRTIHLTHFT